MRGTQLAINGFCKYPLFAPESIVPPDIYHGVRIVHQRQGVAVPGMLCFAEKHFLFQNAYKTPDLF